MIHSEEPSPSARQTSIAELVIADDPSTWSALGFTVENDCCVIGRVVLRLAGPEAGRGIVGWTLRGILSTDLDGLNTTTSTEPPPDVAPVHPNSVTTIDHVVAMSPALDRSVESLQAAGLDLRRIREEPTPAGAPRQAFFRLGPEILELVQEPQEVLERAKDPARRTRFWGLAVRVENLELALESFAPHIGPVRAAVQPGRQIAPVRRSAGLSVPLALMSAPPDTTAAGAN
jgi:hypothetical protein